MIRLTQAVVVEGKYDKIRLSSIIDGVIITTNGFGIFKDKEMMSVLRRLAQTCGIVIMTDSDSAGFLIRNHICGGIKDGKVYNAYIPDVFGKERRKTQSSAEGKLGVEGMTSDAIMTALQRAGVYDASPTEERRRMITKTDLYNDGFTGRSNSRRLREILLRKLDLPERMTTNAMLDVINILLTFDEYKALADECFSQLQLTEENNA